MFVKSLWLRSLTTSFICCIRVASGKNCRSTQTHTIRETQNRLFQKLSGSLAPGAIATCVTDGLIENFDGVFARLWLLELDAQTPWMISSGLSTRTDGEFLLVATRAYKVGKIVLPNGAEPP